MSCRASITAAESNKTLCLDTTRCVPTLAWYLCDVPKIWSDTVEQHRSDVRQSILHTTATLVAERGERAVTMSEIATEVGIGRATLYKYFNDIDSILDAWHEHMIATHLADLTSIAERHSDAEMRLRAVVTRHVEMIQEHHSPGASIMTANAFRSQAVTNGLDRLVRFFAKHVKDAQAEGGLDPTAPAVEYSRFLLHALDAAGSTETKAATIRLIDLALNRS